MKRFVSILLVIAMLACLIPQAFLAPASAATMTLGQLKAKFPHNKYWNHRAESSHYAAACTTCNNPDGWTTHPCQHHDQSAVPVGDYDCNNFNKYGDSWQCAGFARKLAYDVYGNNCLSWTTVTSKATAVSVVKPGDVIHYRQWRRRNIGTLDHGHRCFRLDDYDRRMQLGLGGYRSLPDQLGKNCQYQ